MLPARVGESVPPDSGRLPDGLHGPDGSADGGAPFWRTTAIPLEPGDNLLTVTAMRGEEIQTDQVLVTVNTAFKFGSRLRARPDVLLVGQPKVRTVFTIGADLYRSFVPGTIRLVQTDSSGVPNSGSAISDCSRHPTAPALDPPFPTPPPCCHSLPSAALRCTSDRVRKPAFNPKGPGRWTKRLG